MLVPVTDQTSSTGRVEAFSDGVFAIAITLLVLEIAVPGVDALREHRGSLLLALLADWPVYLAYVATFLAVGTIWLNHHAFFGRLERVDGPVLWWNLMLLLGVSVLPFPNALVARYLGADLWDTSARTATAVYAFVFLLGSVPWFFLARHVLRHPELLRPEVDLTFQRRDSRRSVIGIVGYAVAVPIAYLVPIGVLVLLAGAAVFYIVTARGFAAPRPS